MILTSVALWRLGDPGRELTPVLREGVQGRPSPRGGWGEPLSLGRSLLGGGSGPPSFLEFVSMET